MKGEREKVRKREKEKEKIESEKGEKTGVKAFSYHRIGEIKKSNVEM